MKKYYVSLVRDLIGCYLVFDAESEEVVRAYLRRYYMDKGVWKLPWCAVYTEVPDCDKEPILIPARCGDLFNDDYAREIIGG